MIKIRDKLFEEEAYEPVGFGLGCIQLFTIHGVLLVRSSPVPCRPIHTVCIRIIFCRLCYLLPLGLGSLGGGERGGDGINSK
jgi:hypothetical protein